MSDVALVFKANSTIDLNKIAGQLERDGGLETAVIISLFTNRRVTEEQLPDLEEDQQGCWGDLLSDIDNDEIGSRLWTLDRSKTVTETLRLFEDYVREALEWLVEDGIAESVLVEAFYNDNKSLYATIEIIRPTGATRYTLLWDEQELRRG